MPPAQRLDAALVARGLSASRTLARKAIEADRVSVRRAGHPAAERVSKASILVHEGDELLVQPAEEDRFVSRGALKLQGALEASGLNPAGLTCLDVGQSTGGFTDLLLQRGALRVLGVEVGHGQLHPRLRDDPRVHCIENTNARDISRMALSQALVASGLPEGDWLPDNGFDLIVMDVSFISMLKISENLKPLLAATGTGLWLVKPQFEVGPAHIGKGGIVRTDALGPAFEARMCDALSSQGFLVKQFMPSPVLGGDGNTEYFVRVAVAG